MIYFLAGCGFMLAIIGIRAWLIWVGTHPASTRASEFREGNNDR